VGEGEEILRDEHDEPKESLHGRLKNGKHLKCNL